MSNSLSASSSHLVPLLDDVDMEKNCHVFYTPAASAVM